MKSFVLTLFVVLLQENQAQNLWKPFNLNNPTYSLHQKERNQQIVYGQPQVNNPTRYVQKTNTIRQSTFVPLKSFYEEENDANDRQFNADVFFTLDELPLHLDTEEFQPEIIVDDLYEPNNQLNQQHVYHHYHPHVPNVVSVEKTHFSLGPGNIKEEQTYFNNKDGQVHALYHTLEATIKGYDNASSEDLDEGHVTNSTSPKSEFTEETVIINPESEIGILNPENESNTEDNQNEKNKPEEPEREKVKEDNYISPNATEA